MRGPRNASSWGRYPQESALTPQPSLANLGEAVPPPGAQVKQTRIFKKTPPSFASLANPLLPIWGAQVYSKSNCNNFPKGREMRWGWTDGRHQRGLQLSTKSTSSSASYHCFGFQAPLQRTETGPLRSGKVTQLLQQPGRPSGTSPCRRRDLPPPPRQSFPGARCSQW